MAIRAKPTDRNGPVMLLKSSESRVAHVGKFERVMI
jgi:hypothetical protein